MSNSVFSVSSYILVLRFHFFFIFFQNGEDFDVGAIDIKTDENQEIPAASQRNNDRLRSTIIGNSAFQWFSMDTRIKVLHDLFPDRSVVPAWNDILVWPLTKLFI